MTPDEFKAICEAYDKDSPEAEYLEGHPIFRMAADNDRLNKELEQLRAGWISVEAALPEAGKQVAVLRLNGTWDRGECSPIYFDGLPAWYMPEGPAPLEDCPYWTSLPDLPSKGCPLVGIPSKNAALIREGVAEVEDNK